MNFCYNKNFSSCMFPGLPTILSTSGHSVFLLCCLLCPIFSALVISVIFISKYPSYIIATKTKVITINIHVIYIYRCLALNGKK